MDYRYVTCLLTDDYLPGVLGLARSLRRTGAQYAMACMILADCSCVDELQSEGIQCLTVPYIAHPFAGLLHEKAAYKAGNYTKLNVFSLRQFTKIVFLDADTLVLGNVDHLFSRPHLTACVAGRSVHPEWTHMNSGVLVVEPDLLLFEDMMAKVGLIEETVPVVTQGDQHFLHAYFRRWWEDADLLLPETYNWLVNDQGPPDSAVLVAHFDGSPKPWSGGANAALWESLLNGAS